MVRKSKAKLVLQLRNQGLSGRAIASAQGIARNRVQAVHESVFALPDWVRVHSELARVCDGPAVRGH
jgi:transposase